METPQTHSNHVVHPYWATDNKRDQAQELRVRRFTKAERIVWSRLSHNKLRGAHFRRQHVIDGFIVDFYCHAARLVVEVDGSIHDLQRGYDQERDAVLTAKGLLVLRFSNTQVETNLRAVMLRIAQAVTSRSNHQY